MKNVLFFFFTLILSGAVISCSGKKESAETAAVSSDEWPTMDEFHMIMAESFHPYKDSSNLEPAKLNAAEMATIAEKWAGEQLPEKVNNEETKAALEKLKSGTAAFAQTVQGGDSTQIASGLTELHDLFHTLQEAWYKGGSGEESHKH
jgi:hypothetical protein